MSRKKDARQVGRRAVLRGAGAAVALPWLDSLARALSCQRFVRECEPPRPVRLAVLYMPNGAWPQAWNPSAEGRDWELTPTLEPLAPVRGDVLVLTGLRNANSADGDGHYAKTAPFLTGARIRRTGGRDLENGVSMDQVAAAALDGAAPLRSLELGCEPVRPMEDMGYSTVYGGHISWSSPTTPCTKEIVPRLVFDRLFRCAEQREARRERSVLDVVREDARRLEPRLGRADRGKLAEYFESLRELERRIDRCAKTAAPAGIDPSLRPPEGAPASHEEHVQLMLDLLVLAFRTDATRVATFMFGNAVSGIDMSFLEGVKGGHHELSHHEGKPEKIAQYQRISRWHVAQFARTIEGLRAIDDGGGASLLDRSLVLFGSALKDGNSHDPNDLPLLLAGRGDGGDPALPPLATGRHLRFPDATPLCGLYVSLLRRVGAPVESFGDSAGALLG
jgi:hypothetical protein